MSGEEFQKFLALEEEKRQRIINAAMGEFLNGFKKASTDNIVREAGISKGLLFHYFGTKERLYNFLVDYAIETVQREYIDLINVRQKDILDSIWQLSLLKQDLSQRFPTIFEFLASVYLDDNNCSATPHIKRFQQLHQQVSQEIYNHCDHSMFKEGIPPGKAIEIIQWALEGFSNHMVRRVAQDKMAKSVAENYDDYLAEFKEYLDILRRCFYK